MKIQLHVSGKEGVITRSLDWSSESISEQFISNNVINYTVEISVTFFSAHMCYQ